MANRLPLDSLLLASWVALGITSGKCQTSNLAPERITTRPGLAVFREKPFFSDELVKCLSFRRIEDRTAANNPNHGYLVFMTVGGEVKLGPQAVEELFFLDEFEFPQLMKPFDDLNRLAALKGRIQRVSKYNNSIRRIFEPHALKISEAVIRLENDEWWEAGGGHSGGRWITKREREIRTADAEKKALEVAASEAQGLLESSSSLDALNSVDKSIEVLDDLPATDAEVSAFKSSLITDLRQKASARRMYLETEQLNMEAAQIRSMIDHAATTEDIDNVFVRMRTFEVTTATSPEVAKEKKRLISDISELRDLKSRRLQLSNPVFDTFAEWQQAIKQARNESKNDAALANLVGSSEDDYRTALAFQDQLRQVIAAFKLFLSELPSDALVSGRGLPPLPNPQTSHGESFEAFLASIDAGVSAKIDELVAAADYLKRLVHLYQELTAVSKRSQRQDLWRNLDTFEDLLASMPSIQSSILSEKSEFALVTEKAQTHENAREFSQAADAYQKAYDISPTPDLYEKVQSMKNQDLGL